MWRKMRRDLCGEASYKEHFGGDGPPSVLLSVPEIGRLC